MNTTTKLVLAIVAAAVLIAPAAAATQSSAINKNYWFPTASAYGALVCGQEDDPGQDAFAFFNSAPEDHGIGGACFDVSSIDGTVKLTAQDYAEAPPVGPVDPQTDVSESYDWIIGGYYHLDTPGEVSPVATPADGTLDRTNADLANHLDPQAPSELLDPTTAQVTDGDKDWHIFCTHGQSPANAAGTPVTIDVKNVDTLKVRVDTLYTSTVQCEDYHDVHRSPVAHADNPIDSLASGDPVGTPPTAGTITVTPTSGN